MRLVNMLLTVGSCTTCYIAATTFLPVYAHMHCLQLQMYLGLMLRLQKNCRIPL